jgi:hypothetical protein
LASRPEGDERLEVGLEFVVDLAAAAFAKEPDKREAEVWRVRAVAGAVEPIVGVRGVGFVGRWERAVETVVAPVLVGPRLAGDVLAWFRRLREGRV